MLCVHFRLQINKNSSNNRQIWTTNCNTDGCLAVEVMNASKLEDISLYSKRELMEECRSAGLYVFGDKATLFERLKKHINNDPSNPPPCKRRKIESNKSNNECVSKNNNSNDIDSDAEIEDDDIFPQISDVQLIYLNVGGSKFAISLQNIASYKESNHKLSKLQPNTETNAYFIDRDPTYFKFILDFLRDGKVFKQNLLDLDINVINYLKKETMFLGLHDILFDDYDSNSAIKISFNLNKRHRLHEVDNDCREYFEFYYSKLIPNKFILHQRKIQFRMEMKSTELKTCNLEFVILKLENPLATIFFCIELKDIIHQDVENESKTDFFDVKIGFSDGMVRFEVVRDKTNQDERYLYRGGGKTARCISSGLDTLRFGIYVEAKNQYRTQKFDNYKALKLYCCGV